MRLSEPGENAVRLPWLAPGTAALVALARSGSADVWPRVRTDPGAVLLLASYLSDDSITVPSSLLTHAIRNLDGDANTFIDWKLPAVAQVYRAAIAFARLSERIARQIGASDPFRAWATGLLAPLGWMAIAAVDPDAVGDCLREPVYADDLPDVQRRLWRLDAFAIGRRLARLWSLPTWLRFVVGELPLPAETAAALGSDDRLFRITQLAVAHGQANGFHLGLPIGTPADELAISLNLTKDDLSIILQQWRSESIATPTEWSNPRSESLLPDLLAISIEKRRMEEGPTGESLEREVDRLYETLLVQSASESQRLHTMKLRSVAELAAGAGHEINNPLAVISGQSQYLLARESDPDKQKSLQSIIRQSERVYHILVDLMQFARPPQARRHSLDLRSITADAIESHRARATAKSVRLEFTAPADPAPSHADAAMIRTALGNMVRNAIEAAPTDGTVRLSLEAVEKTWEIVVEDSGPGPDEEHREHLFDPFYSGRMAGRGRGLGLATAWRLVTENHGDVRYAPLEGHPARFVLTLPRSNPFSRDETIRDGGTALKIA